MFDKPLNSITREDLENLVVTEVPESATLDYKETLPGGTDKNKKDFLADVSAFANASGGHIIYGVTERKGPDGQGLDFPESVKGLELSNPATEITRLQQIVDSNIDPKIPGIQLQVLPYKFEKGPVIIIRIPSSWVSPHIITYKEDFRFYLRIGRKKVRMDLDHIRAAILGEGAQITAARNFRNERLGKLISNQTPVAIPNEVMTILHVIPVLKKNDSNFIDMNKMHERATGFAPICFGQNLYINHRYNFDGIAIWLNTNDNECKTFLGYVQLFRSGAIEAVDVYIINKDSERKEIYTEDFERYLVKSVKRYLDFLFGLGISPPVMICLSLVGVGGYHVVNSEYHRHYINREIDREHLIFPEYLLLNIETPPVETLKMPFDLLWQASGFPRSQNFDEAGNWLLG
jgi:hypothetical protein